MGFSVFSIVEVFYFLSIRPYSNYMKVSDKRRKTLNRVFKKVKKLRTRRRLTPLLNPHVDVDDIVGHSSYSVYP